MAGAGGPRWRVGAKLGAGRSTRRRIRTAHRGRGRGLLAGWRLVEAEWTGRGVAARWRVSVGPWRLAEEAAWRDQGQARRVIERRLGEPLRRWRSPWAGWRMI
jgi:hypothetical protein